VILRGATLAAESRHLGAQPVPEPVAPPAESLAEFPVNLVSEAAAVYEHAPEPLPLSSDHVASWLITQDGATRTAVAAVLSEDLTAVRDAARDEGYAQGHAEAMTEARDKVRGAIAALAALHESAEQAFAGEIEKLQESCADVVAEAFFKLAGTALASREAIVGVVGEVLKRVREERELRIHANPQDLPVLRTAEAGIAASLPGRQFSLIADGRVEAGGCMVESALGSLDGRLEVQLAGLIATLRTAKDPGVRS